ncbi:glycosyltransferase [Streptomyces stramineus]
MSWPCAAPQELPGLFAHLAVQTYLGEIDVVVVDHGPRPVIDATALRRWWVPTRVVHEPRPGLPHAHNTGIEAATGRWILITSPDAMPAPDWVRAMVSALTHSGASLAGGRVLPQFTAARPRPYRLTCCPCSCRRTGHRPRVSWSLPMSCRAATSACPEPKS